MNRFLGILRKNLIGKEVKKMKRLITLATALMFVLTSSVPAGAFVSDATRVLNAEADLATGIPDQKTLSHTLRNRDGSTSSDQTKINWVADAAKVWKTAEQYIQINYQANLPGWGIQIWTDNKATTAIPQWVEKPADPNNLRADRPAGLVGAKDPNGDGNFADRCDFIAIPIAWKAFPGGSYGKPQYSDGTGFSATTEYRIYYTEPKERAFGDPATDDYYIELYQYSPNPAAAIPNLYGKCCWLIDKGSQKWNDADNDGVIDAGEIVTDYSDGADINTVVNYLGSSTCTYDSTGTFIYRDACVSPIYVTLAAKIAVGSIKAKYSTNKLTIQLYHE